MADMTDTEPLPSKVDRIEARVDGVERKLDALSQSVDERFAQVDKRFDEVDKRFDEVDKRFDEVSEHFVEQREYTEFAFERLRKETADGFTRVEGLVATNTSGLVRLERKLDQLLTDHRPPGRRRTRRLRKKR